MTSQTWEESNPSLITLQYLNSIPTASFVWLSKPHQPKKSELEQVRANNYCKNTMCGVSVLKLVKPSSGQLAIVFYLAVSILP